MIQIKNDKDMESARSSFGGFRSARSEQEGALLEDIPLDEILRKKGRIGKDVFDVSPQRGALEELYKKYQKEQKAMLEGEEQSHIPRLDTLPKNYIRVTENIVFRTTPRYIAITEKIQKQYPELASDPVWLLEEIQGKIIPRDKALVQRKLSQLLAKTYKVNGRAAKSFKYRDIVIMYKPIEEALPEGTVRLTQLWGLKGNQAFINNFGTNLEDRKHMRNGFDSDDKQYVVRILTEISKYREDDENSGTEIEILIVKMCSDWKIPVPTNKEDEPEFEIFSIPSINDDLIQRIYINQYLSIVRIMKDSTFWDFIEEYEYSNLALKLQDAMDSLEQKIDSTDFSIPTLTKLIYFENYDFNPPSLDVKIDIYQHYAKIQGREKLRIHDYVSPKGVFTKKASVAKTQGKYKEQTSIEKRAQGLTQYKIDGVPVPTTLRNVVKEYLGDIAFIEDEFYSVYGDNISEYIITLAEISSNAEKHPMFKQRLLSGDLGEPKDLIFIDRKIILPELYTNSKLTSNKKALGRLEKYLDNQRNEEANFILSLWQPAVKKNWFPIVSTPTYFNIEEWIVDPVGASCGFEMIYVLTPKGLECLSKEYIREHLEELLPLNRKDLADLVGGGYEKNVDTEKTVLKKYFQEKYKKDVPTDYQSPEEILNYYGIQTRADWRLWLSMFHPDKSKDPNAAEKTKLVLENGKKLGW